MPTTTTSVSTPGWQIFAIGVGFLVVFPLFWCFVVWLISRVGGWRRLAERYAVGDRPVTGERRSGFLAFVGSARYRGVLTLHLAEDGFFMEVMPLFTMGHPRLFIPWSEISARAPYQARFWNAERLSIGQPVVTTITLPADLLPNHRARGR